MLLVKLHQVFAFQLLALAAGAAIVLLAQRTDGCRLVGKIFGIAIVVLALGSMVCLGTNAWQYGKSGVFERPMTPGIWAEHEGKGGHEGHGGADGGKMECKKCDMMDCPMMKEKMKGGEAGPSEK